MKLLRAALHVFPIAVLFGCKADHGNTVTTATATTAVAHVPTAASAHPSPAEQASKDLWKPRRRSSTAWSFLEAAHALELTDDEKAGLDKLAEQLQPEPTGPRPEMKDYNAALVAEVRAGKLDTAKLGALAAVVDKAQQARQEKEDAALTALSPLLEPTQRRVVVASVRTKQATRDFEAGKRAEEAGKHRLESLTKELDLDAAQQKKVEAILAKDTSQDATRDDMRKRSDALATAFDTPGFDAKKVQPGPSPVSKAMGLRADFLTALLAVLKPDQREKLAAWMERQPGAWMGGMGTGGERSRDRVDGGAGEPAAQP